MGQIGSYTEMSAAPAVDDLLFIADASNSNQIMKIQTDTLHSAPVFKGGAAGGNLSLADGDGDIGITLQDGGNVVIGNTSPAFKLDIKTTVSPTDTSQALLRLYASYLDSYPYLEFRNDVQQYRIVGVDGPNNDSFNIKDVTAGAYRFTLTTSGSVGIGNTGPTSRLHVGDGTATTTPSFELEGGTHSSGPVIGPYSVYLYSDGTNGPGIASSDVMHIMRNVSSATKKTFFYYDNGATYKSPLVVLANGATRRVGIGIHNPDTPLHVEGTGTILKINATSGNSSFQLSDCFFINEAAAGTYLQIKDTDNTPNQAKGIVISKGTGYINIGSSWQDSTTPDFLYPLAIGNLHDKSSDSRATKTTAAYIASSSTSGVRLALVANAANDDTAAIGYAAANQFNWLAGSFEDTSVEYFGITTLGGTAITAPDNTVFYSTLETNTVYINGATSGNAKGGVNASNTPAAFGSAVGNGTAGPTNAINGSGQYNVASLTMGGSTNIVTVAFSNDLAATGDASTYTVMASGFDGQNTQVMWGEASSKATGSFVLTFQTASGTPDLKRTDVKWTWAVYGAKHKA